MQYVSLKPSYVLLFSLVYLTESRLYTCEGPLRWLRLCQRRFYKTWQGAACLWNCLEKRCFLSWSQFRSQLMLVRQKDPVLSKLYSGNNFSYSRNVPHFLENALYNKPILWGVSICSLRLETSRPGRQRLWRSFKKPLIDRILCSFQALKFFWAQHSW